MTEKKKRKFRFILSTIDPIGYCKCCTTVTSNRICFILHTMCMYNYYLLIWTGILPRDLHENAQIVSEQKAEPIFPGDTGVFLLTTTGTFGSCMVIIYSELGENRSKTLIKIDITYCLMGIVIKSLNTLRLNMNLRRVAIAVNVHAYFIKKNNII